MTSLPNGSGPEDHPHQPASDEADREKETSPAGVAGDLEEKAEELGASPTPPPDDERPAGH